MIWQTYITISVLTLSVSFLIQRVLLRENNSDPIAYSIISSIITGLAIGIYAFLKGFVLPDFANFWFNTILMVVFYAVGYVFVFKSLKLTEASTFTVLFTTRAIWSIITAIIFLHEIIGINNIVGTILILVGVALVSFNVKDLKLHKGEIFSLIAAALIGIAFTNDAIIINQSDVASYLSISYTLPGLVIWLFQPQKTSKMIEVVRDKRLLFYLAIFAILDAVSVTTQDIAYKIGHNAIQVAPLAQTTTIVTVILAVIFLKEKTQLGRKVSSAFLTFIGIILVGS